jgi:hypothetical protein
MKSAFDDSEQYELTSIGRQFVHYAMTDLPTKITYQPADDDFTEAPGITPETERAKV